VAAEQSPSTGAVLAPKTLQEARCRMFVIRDVMQCKPGKVREMVNKFKSFNALAPKVGMPPSRILTDVSGEPFWTVVAITEVESLDNYFAAMDKAFANEEARMVMAGYHDLVVNGRRDIYKLEA
jgi:hypothetical protein